MTTLIKTLQPNQPNLKLLMQHPAYFCGLGFGSGLAKKAPGTFGTLIGFPLFWLIAGYSLSMQLLIISILFVIGIYFCSATGKALGVADHGGIVWDEFVGYWITMFLAPKSWVCVLMGFVLFRFFDIVNLGQLVGLIKRSKVALVS